MRRCPAAGRAGAVREWLVAGSPYPYKIGELTRDAIGHVLTRVVCKGAHALGILKERAYELVVLNALLSQTRWRRGRRSRWHERRACLLMTHWPKERQTWQQAINFVEEAIKDEDTHIGAFQYWPGFQMT